MRVEVDTGNILEFPDDASEAEIDAGVNEFLAEQEQPTLETPISTAEDIFVRQPLRAGRSAVVGATSLLDAPRIVTDPALQITGWAAKKMGFPETGEYISTQAKAPYFGEMAREGIDEATGDYLKPRNTTEKVADFVDEIGFAAMTPTVVAAGANKVKSAFKKDNLPDADVLREKSKALYDKVLQTGREFDEGLSGKLSQSVDDFIPKTQFQSDLAEGATSRKMADLLKKYEGKKLSIADIDALDKKLTGEHFRLMVSDPAEARNISVIQDNLRSVMQEYPAGKELAEARALWAQQAKIRDLDEILVRASRTDNPAQAIRTGFGTLLKNKKRMAGYTDAERKLIDKAARTGLRVDALRVIGSRLNAIATAAATGNVPLAATVFTAGAGARKLAEKVQAGKGEKIIDAVFGRGERPVVSPLTQQERMELIRKPKLTDKVPKGPLKLTIRPDKK